MKTDTVREDRIEKQIEAEIEREIDNSILESAVRGDNDAHKTAAQAAAVLERLLGKFRAVSASGVE